MNSYRDPHIKNPNDRATLAFVLGLVGIVCCAPCAPFAWYYGQSTLNAIRDGYVGYDRRGFALAGKILGIVGCAVLAIALLVFLIAL